jgi:SAM-dependent methyltransferase
MDFTVRDCIKEPLISGRPSSIDHEYYTKMRSFIKDNIYEFVNTVILENKITENRTLKIVDVGLTGNVNNICHRNIIFHTIDIDGHNNPTYVCDITKNNNNIIDDNTYDVCILSEVLEHTENPFNAFDEVHRITKKHGYIIITSPLNFRIHGPLFDTMRMTEWYYKNTAKKYGCEIVRMLSLEDATRTMFPISYFCALKKQ